MSDTVLAAVVQMTSTADVERNLARAEALVERAARARRPPRRPARELRLPALRGPAGARSRRRSTGRGCGGWRSWRAAHRITLLLGSLPERIAGDARVHNTSVLLGPDGATLAVYRKIHLFDIDLPGMEHLKESRSVAAGREIVVVDTPAGALGLSICYDVRFPELYRELARRGARVLCVPAAFTERTGKAHWELLLRARAIENLAYVFAPAQVGQHGGGRASHGQAMIVDPWGLVARPGARRRGRRAGRARLRAARAAAPRAAGALARAAAASTRREATLTHALPGSRKLDTRVAKCHKNSRFAPHADSAPWGERDQLDADLHSEGGRDRPPMVRDRRERQGARQGRHGRRRCAHRQAQADLHALPRHG